MTALETFVKKNPVVCIPDDGAYESEGFRKFAWDFLMALRKDAKAEGFEVVKLTRGHYDFSGFLKRRERYVYFSYGVKRGGLPTDLNSSDHRDQMMFREVDSENDYTGGINHYCKPAQFVQMAKWLLD